MSTTVYRGLTYVVPCGGRKLERRAPARDLYTGSMFRHTLSNVERLAAADEAEGRGPARVLIMSARYGLVHPDWVLDPYEQRIDGPGAVSVEKLAHQAWVHGIGWDEERQRGSEVYALLPRPYLAKLDAALRTLDVYVQDVYEGTRGIGEQKRVNAHVGQSGPPAAVPDSSGLTVWLGADVAGFWWGVPILVSYGRLREAKTLPVATAHWVCDSRGFNELADHGRWTIPPEVYARDLDRYADEIGNLVWAAPQDWPASKALLAKTGLTEVEHQRRTIASVVELRRLTRVPIIAIVTAETPAGYLRHVHMYAEAGIDLRSEQVVVGVGALMGRPPQEAADIIALLHAAGLTRLHGLGVKGRVLDLAGPLLESVDSAAWSAGARRRTGPCPHGLVEWEANCPVAAQEWGKVQRLRAETTAVQGVLPMFDPFGQEESGLTPPTVGTNLVGVSHARFRAGGLAQ